MAAGEVLLVDLAVGPLNPGDSVTLPHGLCTAGGLYLRATSILPDRATPIIVTADTDRTATFFNAGAVPTSANFRVIREHSIQAPDAAASSPMRWQGVVPGATDDAFTGQNKDITTIQAGQAVAVDPSGTGFVRANYTTRAPIGLAQTTTAVGFAVPVQVSGVLVLPDWTAAVGAPTLANGVTYFATATPGVLSSVAPTIPGTRVQTVGRPAAPNALDILIGLGVLL